MDAKLSGKLDGEIVKELAAQFHKITFSRINFPHSSRSTSCDLGPEWLDRYVRVILLTIANGLEMGASMGAVGRGSP